jgi:hypothetical protein
VASGAGRLLPPQVLRVGVAEEEQGGQGPAEGAGTETGEGAVPAGGPGPIPAAASGPVAGGASEQALLPQQRTGQPGPELRLVEQRQAPEAALDDAGAAELLDVVGQLVDRARAAGELRPDVTVSDVLLVIATAAPSLPDAAQQAAASARLLDILLEGLRSRPHG